MVDDDWYLHAAQQPAIDARPPGAPLNLRKNGKQIDCELRFHGESYGGECQCLHNGELATASGSFVRRVSRG